MPPTFGLSEKGFKAKEFSIIKDELEKALLAQVDPTLRFGPDTVVGIVTGIVANQARQVWESLHGLYHSLQPDTASGRALDALCSLTGTYRKKAAYSKATVMVTLDAKAKVAHDARLQNIGGHFFKVVKEVTNTSNVKADFETEAIAEDIGPIVAHKDTEAKIMTPAAGFLKAIFKLTREIGRFDETDDELRLRRLGELKATGTSTIDALRSRLRQVDQVEAVYVKEGSRSFEAVIKGGKDEDIAKTLWQCRPLGVETVGGIECTVIDSIGAARKIRFSRPAEVALTLHTKLKVQRNLESAELNALKASLIDCGKKNFSLGAEVYASRFIAKILDNPLVLDVISLHLRDRTSGNFPAEIKPEQIASLAFKDIYIDHVVEAAQ